MIEAVAAAVGANRVVDVQERHVAESGQLRDGERRLVS
jgi:hypothetical protein